MPHARARGATVRERRLLAFRDTDGRLGVLDEYCPHRRASLVLGRNEECGLRCLYHGWKFDVDGNVVEMTSEPAESGFAGKAKHKAYPAREAAGFVWTYMGPSEKKPGFPELEWTRVPDSHRYVTRHLQECNWFQGVEGRDRVTPAFLCEKDPGDREPEVLIRHVISGRHRRRRDRVTGGRCVTLRQGRVNESDSGHRDAEGPTAAARAVKGCGRV